MQIEVPVSFGNDQPYNVSALCCSYRGYLFLKLSDFLICTRVFYFFMCHMVQAFKQLVCRVKEHFFSIKN